MRALAFAFVLSLMGCVDDVDDSGDQTGNIDDQDNNPDYEPGACRTPLRIKADGSCIPDPETLDPSKLVPTR